jgi:hypothetical protein
MTERKSALCGVLRSQVTAAIDGTADDERWPYAAVDAVMALIEPAIEAVRNTAERPSVAAAKATAAEGKLAEVRKRAGEWAALAPADDWGLTPTAHGHGCG